MIDFVLRLAAFVFFMLAGFDKVVLNQSPFDWVAFGLAAWVLATLLEGWGPPPSPRVKKTPPSP
jgi:hypothetical protein